MYVSIITATLDRPSLAAACASVDAQEFRSYHHYVIGDGVMPVDHTSDRRTTIGFSRHIGGDEPAMNMPYGTPNPVLRWALHHLNLGEYFCVLDDDNTYRPRFLGEMVRALQAAQYAAITLCPARNWRNPAPLDGYPEFARCDMSAFLVRTDVARAIDFPCERPDRLAISDCDFIVACAAAGGWVRTAETLVDYGTGERWYPFQD